MADLSLPRNGECTISGAKAAAAMSGIDNICFSLSGHLDNCAVASKSRHKVHDQHITMYTAIETRGVSVSLVDIAGSDAL